MTGRNLITDAKNLGFGILKNHLVHCGQDEQEHAHTPK
jgi:hypothetical protein